jgi:hypothetical protein
LPKVADFCVIPVEIDYRASCRVCPFADIPLDDHAAAHDGRFDTRGLEFAAAQLISTESSDPPVANC